MATTERQFVAPERYYAEFQCGLLAHLLNHESLMQAGLGVLEVEDFGLAACQLVWTVAERHYRQHGKLLLGDELVQQVNEAIRRGDTEPILMEAEFDSLEAVLREVVNGDHSHAEYYAEQLEPFVAHIRRGRILLDAEEVTKQGGSLESVTARILELEAELASRAIPASRLTLADLESFTPDPDDTIAGDGWLHKGRGTLCTGGTGLGKSVFSTQIAVSVAGGVDILRVIPVPKPRRVVLVEAENDIGLLKRDVLSIVSVTRADRATVQQNLTMYHLYGCSGADFVSWLQGVVSKDRPELLIVDPYQAYAGAADFNNTQPFLRWIEPIDRMLKQHNCAFLLVAHTPKPRERDNWNARDLVYAAAGTSALSNWVRASCELLPAGQEIDRFRLTFGKNAQWNGIRPAQVGLGFGQGVVRELYIEQSPCPGTPYWTVSQNQLRPVKSKYTAAVETYLQEHPKASTREVAAAVGCSQSTAARFCRGLKQEEEGDDDTAKPQPCRV